MLLHIFNINNDVWDWVLFPLIIFCAKVTDVSLGTLRSVLAAKGKKRIVPFIGFVEVLIWLIAIGQIVQNLTNIMCYIAWAGGYATGSYVGLIIEERLALGLQVVRIITNQNCDTLLNSLQEENFGTTILDGQGARGPVKMIFTIVKRKQVKNVVKLINQHNPTSFYSVEDVKDASQLNTDGKGKQAWYRKLFAIIKE